MGSHTNQKISIVPAGTKWPSGNCIPLAILALEISQVEELIGCVLTEGVEEGLGPWLGIGFLLPCGELVELVKYAQAPPPGGFEVRADANAKCDDLLVELLLLFNIGAESVLWVNES